jgi:hypothetical protein
MKDFLAEHKLLDTSSKSSKSISDIFNEFNRRLETSSKVDGSSERTSVYQPMKSSEV